MTPYREKSATGDPFFCSWSGGKDSCLSLYRAVRRGMRCAALFTMFVEDGSLSRSHGQPARAVEAQAEAMGIPLRTACASWDDYEQVFKQTVRGLITEGVRDGVFGDIDLQAHREWIERVCGEIGVRPHLPLWQEERRGMVHEFLQVGFKAVIVAVNAEKLDGRFLGRTLDLALLDELEAEGIDLCGEEGEYHTFVYDGPLFKQPVVFAFGPAQEHKGYRFVALAVRP
ncbi:MAG: diphthine--ammonia ligase [Deltaproteobacteria bacterium]|nr:diphthine--ammonia ligase [Deltaproteobacteria bacterium]